MNAFEKALEASHLITRAEQGRARAWSALRRMRRQKKGMAALRDYVAAAAMTEEAELALLKIKREIQK
jgi:hypothetical protein